MGVTIQQLAQQLGFDIEEPRRAKGNYHNNSIAYGRPPSPMRFSYGAMLSIPRPNAVQDVGETARKLQELCAWARANSWTVRAMGSAWSFSDVIAPGRTLNDRKSVLINTRRNFKLIRRSGVNPTLCYVTAGVTLRDINKQFESVGLSLKTSGSSDGQTIAGAIGTGVHGSAYRFGAVHDSVRAYHVVTPQQHVLVCRDEASFPSALRNEFGPLLSDPTIRVDSHLFDALSVSFGSLGIVVGVVLEADERYALNVIRRRLPANKLGRLIQIIRTDGDFSDLDPALAPDRASDAPHHCQVLVNPYNRNEYRVVLMYQRPGFSPPSDFEWPQVFDEHGLEMARLLWRLAPHFDNAYEGKVSEKFDEMPDLNAWGFRSKVFGKPEQPLPVHSFGVGVALANTERALALAHDAVARERFPGAGELRFVKSSPAHLAINRFAPITAVIGFDGLDNEDSWEFSQLYLSSLRREHIAFTFHWGKMTDMKSNVSRNSAALAAVYGQSLVEWKKARREFLGDDGAVFENAFVRRLGFV